MDGNPINSCAVILITDQAVWIGLGGLFFLFLMALILPLFRKY